MKLYLDTSERNNHSVKLTGDGVEDEIAGAEDVFVAMDQILKRNNLSIDDVEEIDYNRGPGSFVGLRISAAVANAFNWAVGGKDIEDLEYPNYGGEPNIG
jgi:tRNA A37 threonylcarbamoyladenosine modification protein TsaB